MLGVVDFINLNLILMARKRMKKESY